MRLNLTLDDDVYKALRQLIDYWPDIKDMSAAARRAIVEARDRQEGLELYKRVVVAPPGQVVTTTRVGTTTRGARGVRG